MIRSGKFDTPRVGVMKVNPSPRSSLPLAFVQPCPDRFGDGAVRLCVSRVEILYHVQSSTFSPFLSVVEVEVCIHSAEYLHVRWRTRFLRGGSRVKR